MGAQEPRRLPSAVLPGCLHKADGRQMCANKQRLHNCIPGWNKIPKAHSHFLGKAGCSYRAAVLEEVGLMAGRSPGSPALAPSSVSSPEGAQVCGAWAGLPGAAVHKEIRTGHSADGGKERKLLNSEGCRENQLCSVSWKQAGGRLMGAMCLLGSLPHWQKENAHFVCPPMLSFPGGCRCCGGHRVPGWGILEMSRGRTKEGCNHKNISAGTAETPPLSFLTSEAKASRSAVRAASQQLLSHGKVSERTASPPQIPFSTEKDF